MNARTLKDSKIRVEIIDIKYDIMYIYYDTYKYIQDRFQSVLNRFLKNPQAAGPRTGLF
jgi:hypothetical protein